MRTKKNTSIKKVGGSRVSILMRKFENRPDKEFLEDLIEIPKFKTQYPEISRKTAKVMVKLSLSEETEMLFDKKYLFYDRGGQSEIKINRGDKPDQ